MLLDLLRSSPLAFALLAGILLYSLALHELGHAWVADKMGDKTARNLGRITLNPLKHLDPIGTLLIMVAGFGWAKPVPIQPAQFRNYRQGMFWVSIAGVLVNAAIAVLVLLVLAQLGLRQTDGQLRVLPGSSASRLVADSNGQALLNALLFAVRINLLLVVFNLLPIPPLDGSKILQAFAPAAWQAAFWQAQRYGFLLVIVVISLFSSQVFGMIDQLMALLMALILAG